MGSDVSQRPSRQTGRAFRSVRFKIILLLLVPLVSLSTLWAFTLWTFAASNRLGDGLNLLHVTTLQDHLGYPSGALGSALEQERRLSLVFLGSKSAGDRAAMESGRLVTDRQAEQFRRLATDKGAQNMVSAQAKGLTQEILQYLDSLPSQRRVLDAGAGSRAQTFSRYTGAISSTNALQTSLSTLSNPEATKDARTQVALARAREVLSQEDALLSGAIAAGHLTVTEYVQFTKLVGTQRTQYADELTDLRTPDRALYQRITATPEFTRLKLLEDRFTDHVPTAGRRARGTAAGGATPAGAQLDPATAAEWKTTASSVLTRLRGMELASTAAAAQRAKPIATSIIVRVAVAGALGLVAVIVSLVLSVWVGRSVIRELTGLRRAALDLANERLPRVIRRLRSGEDVDVAAEAPPLAFSTREIDQVGQAFNAARRTAIQGAVEEATLRRSISEVFLNLARRNQALLHRQLSLLDTMERRIAEPEELQDLFRLDHLATRMRRHAEGLIILSGQAAGRGWRNPVPAVDVARAAAAEVEAYARVTVAAMPRFAIAGKAVADVIHLLAELIENATLFSPPDTTVQVSGQVVAHGFAMEVEDRGLSMDAASLARANERLADPPEFDLSNSAQLGLFVVGRLAQRHSIQVTLRTSPYGGTTAIVLLPEAIVVRGDDQPELESGGRLAMTRRAEDALVPIGAIGSPPPYAGNGTSSDTGPMPIVGGDRPLLPRRRDDPAPQAPPMPPAPHEANPYAAPPQETGPYDAGPYEAPPSGPSAYDPGRYGTDRQDPAAYGTGAYEASGYASGGHDSGPGSGNVGDGQYGDGGYGSPSTGTGQWALPEPGTGRPPLPQRRGGGPEPSRLRSVFEPTSEPGAEPEPQWTPPPDQAGTGHNRPALPRRVRQANLAPQLRDDVQPVGDTAASGERSPEELRTMLNSIQKGWLRGRSDSGQTTADDRQEDI